MSKAIGHVVYLGGIINNPELESVPLYSLPNILNNNNNMQLETFKTPGPSTLMGEYFEISQFVVHLSAIITTTRVKWTIHDHPRSRTSLIHIIDRLSRRCYPTMHVREMIVEV